MAEREYDEEELERADPDDEGDECYWCGGEGVTQCMDQLECTNRHDKYGYCRCGSCGGSGLAKDMTVW